MNNFIKFLQDSPQGIFTDYILLLAIGELLHSSTTYLLKTVGGKLANPVSNTVILVKFQVVKCAHAFLLHV